MCTIQGRSGTLSSFVSSFGKNVRKYAEVGFQRLVVALPTKLTAEELEEYTAVVTKLCDKCQVRRAVFFVHYNSYICCVFLVFRCAGAQHVVRVHHQGTKRSAAGPRWLKLHTALDGDHARCPGLHHREQCGRQH